MSEARRWAFVAVVAVGAAAAAFLLAPRTGPATDPRLDRTAGIECPPGRVRFRDTCVPRASCPPGRVPISGVCIRTTAPDAGSTTGPSLSVNSHTEHDGTTTVYQLVALSPDRPRGFDSYVHPVPPADPIVTSGFDLHLPDAKQRRGNPRNPVGHGGLDYARPIGTPVVSAPLEGQLGATRVLFVGMLFGRTVATLHERQDGAWVAVHGHLDRVAPGIEPGATVEPGALVGSVGDSWTPGVPHLHYEIRWVRTGVDPWTLWGRDLWNDDLAVPCDPRVVLPRSGTGRGTGR